MSNLINDAYKKDFSTFSDKTKEILQQKYNDNPIIKNSLSEIEKFNLFKDHFSKISTHAQDTE